MLVLHLVVVKKNVALYWSLQARTLSPLFFPKLVEGLYHGKKYRKKSFKGQYYQIAKFFKSNTATQAVLGIRDILVRIRNKIHGSGSRRPKTSVADPDPDPPDPYVFEPSGSGSTSQRY